MPARLSERGLEGLGSGLRPRGFLGVMVGGMTCFCLRPNRLNRTLRQAPSCVGSSKEERLDGSLELPGHLAGFYSCCDRSSQALGCALEASSSASPRGLDAGLAPQTCSSVRESGRFDLCRRPGGSPCTHHEVGVAPSGGGGWAMRQLPVLPH